MQPYRKPFDSASSFPFALVRKETKSLQRELPDHLHDWYEIVYVYRGLGTFFIDHTLYDMREGDLFLIPGNTIHRASPDPDDPVTSSAIFFAASFVAAASLGEPFVYLDCFERASRLKSYKISLTPPQRSMAETAIERMHDEALSRLAGSRHAVQLELHRLLIAVSRLGEPDSGARSAETPVGPRWMQEALLHIDTHLTGRLGLASVARHAAVAPAHFSRVFKQLTGMNVSEYIAMKRIALAKNMLLHDDSSVGAIAERCGFASMPHFHRTFKRALGTTPAAYRKAESGSTIR